MRTHSVGGRAKKQYIASRTITASRCKHEVQRETRVCVWGILCALYVEFRIAENREFSIHFSSELKLYCVVCVHVDAAVVRLKSYEGYLHG